MSDLLDERISTIVVEMDEVKGAAKDLNAESYCSRKKTGSYRKP